MAESLDYTEELRRVGAELRAAREAQGLDLAAVAAQCRVRTSYLEAIETGAAQKLPEPVFVQGFIRTYARSLGLDPDSFAAELIPTTVAPSNSTPVEKRSLLKLKQPSKAVLGAAALVTAIAATLLGTGWTVWQWRQQQIAIAPTEAPEPPPPPAEAIVSDLPPETPPNTMAIAFRGPAWAEIRVDGEVFFSGMGAAGQKLTVSPKQEITINPGRPDLIWLSREGQSPQPLGTISQVRLYRFAIASESIPSTTEASSEAPPR